MKRRLIEWLVCPACQHALILTRANSDTEAIHEGELACAGCEACYPIIRGIPRLLPATLGRAAVATAERFGYQWMRFAEIRPEYEVQMLGWIAPVGRDAFVGRRVLDAGCGKGRHLRLAAAFGAKDVIGMDLGAAVEVAARNTADLDNVHVVQGDLTRPPFRPEIMDLIYSIGVLHHLPIPEAGVRALTPLLVPGGRFIAWFYAREGNGWVLAFIGPVRRLTSRLPLPAVSAFAWALTVPLWIALRLLYGPARRRRSLQVRLPYSSYLTDLSGFPFREIHSIAFDQLLAPVAHYMPRAHVERCLREGGLTLESLRWHHANSWAASAIRTRAGREN